MELLWLYSFFLYAYYGRSCFYSFIYITLLSVPVNFCLYVLSIFELTTFQPIIWPKTIFYCFASSQAWNNSMQYTVISTVWPLAVWLGHSLTRSVWVWVCALYLDLLHGFSRATSRRGQIGFLSAARVPAITSSDPHPQRSETPRFPPAAHSIGSFYKNGQNPEHYLQSFTASKQLVSYCLEHFLCV